MCRTPRNHAQKARLLQLVPLGRLSRPEEYAALAVYLASDEHHLEWAPVSIFFV
jgi:NAD(P)-dependent dehydrogenase (short-subunit alcohol dehydrogenase family)